MIIQVDDDGRKLVLDVVNAAMKSGTFGADSVMGLATLLTSLTDVPKPKPELKLVEMDTVCD